MIEPEVEDDNFSKISCSALQISQDVILDKFVLLMLSIRASYDRL